jgi:hypothetical protein
MARPSQPADRKNAPPWLERGPGHHVQRGGTTTADMYARATGAMRMACSWGRNAGGEGRGAEEGVGGLTLDAAQGVLRRSNLSSPGAPANQSCVQNCAGVDVVLPLWRDGSISWLVISPQRGGAAARDAGRGRSGEGGCVSGFS